MRPRWPEDTRFTRVVLEVEDNVCAVCGGTLPICDTVGIAFLRCKDLWRWCASEPTALTAIARRMLKRAAPTQKPS